MTLFTKREIMRLNDVTAICVDTKNHALAAYAARVCASKCQFSSVKLLSDLEMGYPIIRIPRLNGIADYNEFILNKIVDHIDTDYALVFQWDGFVINPERWTDAFKDFDYIGAPWSETNVGNGGFSLRSRRFLERSRGLATDFSKNEDGTVTGDLLPALAGEGFASAPASLARQFSFETLPAPDDNTFGFHGDYNFPIVLNENQLLHVISISNEEMWYSRRPLKWVDALEARGETEVAKRIRSFCREIRPAEVAHWEQWKIEHGYTP